MGFFSVQISTVMYIMAVLWCGLFRVPVQLAPLEYGGEIGISNALLIKSEICTAFSVCEAADQCLNAESKGHQNSVTKLSTTKDESLYYAVH